MFEGDKFQEDLVRTLQSGMRDVVLEFLVELPGDHQGLLWKAIRDWATVPDRFHVVDRRVSRWVAAARLPNGAEDELGFDIRDRLWVSMESEKTPS